MTSSGMRWLDIVRLRLRSLLRRGRVERELDEELRFHYESLIERYAAQGHSPDAARRLAHIEAGLPEGVRDGCRDARGLNALDNIARDVRYAARGILHSPGFALAAVTAIALGIGVNTAFFTLAYSVLLRPLPVSDPDTIRNVHVETSGPGRRSHIGTRYFVAWSEFQHIRAHAKTAEVAGIAEVSMSRKGDPRGVRAQLVSDNLLPLTGAKPALGRFFLPEETTKPGGTASLVLSHHAWRDWFGSSPSVVGSLLVLNRTAFTVVGVADGQTKGPLMIVPDVWIPLTMQPVTRAGEPLIHNPRNAWVQLIARRRAGFDDAQMSAEMSVLARDAIRPTLPERRVMVSVVPGAFLNFPFVQRQTAPILGILLLAVTLVLVVSCANVANMLLARGLSRRREIAIRLSIGAGRGRLFQQLLTESLLLSLIGAAAGLALSQLAAGGILGLAPAAALGPHQIDLRPDVAVLAYTMAVAVLTALLFGLLPAFNALRFDLTPALKSEGLESAVRRGSGRLQNGLIAVQVAVSLLLLINAGLLIRGFRHAFVLDTGQDTRNLLVADLDLRQQRWTAEEATRFVTTLRESVQRLPGFVAVSTTFVDPLTEQCGSPANTGGNDFNVTCDEVGPDFFRTAGIRLLHGREFHPAEAAAETPVVVVDERLARDHLGSENAVGRSFRFRDQPVQVIGVVKATRPLDVTSRIAPKVYVPMRGLRHTEAKLLVRYEGPYREIADAIQRASGSVDPNVNAVVRRVEEAMDSVLAPVRIAAAAATGLGVLALLLAATGIYGVVGFAVGRRRREVGIRMALGADRSAVFALVLWQGLKPVAVGAAAGAACGAATSQLIRAMLFGVSPLDPASFGVAAALLTAVATFAMAVPIRQALRVNPAVALRHD
jgi:predicted permease